MKTTIQLMIIFFFQWSTTPRDLHSFPTRRSSDLKRASNGKFDALSTARLCDRFNAGLASHRDRKSTRLNSSHVSISYAVFCLKKKNMKQHCSLHQHIQGMLTPLTNTRVAAKFNIY